MSAPANGPDPAVAPAARDKMTALLFAGATGILSLVFLLITLSGTSGDLLGAPPYGGPYNFEAHAAQLPEVDPAQPPAIFEDKPEATDPMTFDARDGGPPTDPRLLPPENSTEEAAEVDPAVQARRDQERREAAEDATRRAEAKEIMARGSRALRANKYPQAKEIFTQAAKLDGSLKPEIAESFFEKAKGQEARKSWSRAKLLYRMALHFDFENPRYHDALAATSESLGDTKKAAEHRRLAEKFRKQGR